MAIDASLDRALRAISDPTRRRILQALKEKAWPAGPSAFRGALRSHLASHKTANGPARKSFCLCAGDIQKRIDLSQPTISHHMTLLTKAGLVAETKQGQWRWYQRNETALRQLVKTLRTKL